MKLNYLSLWFIASVFLVGCATKHYISGQLFNTNLIDEIGVGMIEEEVLYVLGPPHIREPYIDGAKWIWSFSTVDKGHSFVVRIEDGEVVSLSSYVQ